MVAMKRGKRHYFSYHSSGCLEETILHQTHESYLYKQSLQK